MTHWLVILLTFSPGLGQEPIRIAQPTSRAICEQMKGLFDEDKISLVVGDVVVTRKGIWQPKVSCEPVL